MTTLVDTNNPNFLVALVSIAFFFGHTLGLSGYRPKDIIPLLAVFILYATITGTSFNGWCFIGAFWLMLYNGVVSACIWKNPTTEQAIIPTRGE